MVHLTEVIALSTRMPAVEAIHFEEEVSPHTSIIPTDEKKARHAIFFALGTNGLLFANERLLARNCTSILVTSTHLIYTTTQHLLKFVHMAAVDGKCQPVTRLVDLMLIAR
jgi:elongator complex protein 1